MSFDMILEAADYSKLKKTSVVVNKVYPKVEAKLPKRTSQLKACIGAFITKNYSFLYAPAPFERYYFGKEDFDAFWKAIDIQESEIDEIMKSCYFYPLADFNPRAAKSPFVAALLMCIRYFLKKKDNKNAELCAIYLAFSGQFYVSIHSGQFVFKINKETMEYVINYKMSDKFDLKRTGNVYASISGICLTWLKTYEKDITSNDFDDNDYRLVIQQLHDREKSFLKNITRLYIEARESGEYMNYTVDNRDPENYKLNDNNSSRNDKYVEAAVTLMTTTEIDYKFCGMVADQNVKKDEVKTIMTSIFHNKENIPEIREAVDIIISDYQKAYPNESIHSPKFMTYGMTTKPNSKDKNMIRLKDIITGWLNANSVDYVRRKSRKATAVSYYKMVLKMLVLYINKAINK